MFDTEVKSKRNNAPLFKFFFQKMFYIKLLRRVNHEVLSDYNIKYLNDMRWVRQNTTLYYDVMCHKTDNMFRPFTIRPSSGLTSKAKEEIVKL